MTIAAAAMPTRESGSAATRPRRRSTPLRHRSVALARRGRELATTGVSRASGALTSGAPVLWARSSSSSASTSWVDG